MSRLCKGWEFLGIVEKLPLIVWKDGKIIEMGTHSELLEENGEYRRLWDAQSEYYRVEELLMCLW